MHPTRGDDGTVVIGWLTKLIVVMAIVGIMLFDGLSLGAADLGAADDAGTAASAAAAAYENSHSAETAYQAAVSAISNPTETIPAKTFFVEPDGSVQLKLVRNVDTLVLRHIPPLRHYTQLTVSGEASPPQQ